jgi:hypothetical protein
MSIFRSRATAVVAGAATVVALGATTAVAGDLITSKDVKNNSLTGQDIKNGSLGMKDLNDFTTAKINKRGPQGPKGDQGEQGEQGPAGDLGLVHDELAAPVAIEKIGGPINDNATKLGTGVTLAAGTYLVTVDGAFMSDAPAADPAVNVWPQLSLWIDKNDDGAFRWQEEGSISPNALMPAIKDRHISTSGSTVITLDKETDVNLLAFGYAADQGSARSGEIDVVNATITATPIN